MSFANEFKRAVKEIDQEISYYRGFAGLDGTAEPLTTLEELRDDWQERRRRFEGRGRPPSEPEDWEADKTARVAAKERLDKIIKAAAAAEEAERAAVERAVAQRAVAQRAAAQRATAQPDKTVQPDTTRQPDETTPADAESETPGGAR